MEGSLAAVAGTGLAAPWPDEVIAVTALLHQRLAIATGYAAVLCGLGAALLERPWPANPADLPTFLTENHAAVLGQSLLFAISSGFLLWFLGSLRTWLLRAEVGGRVSMIAFTAGMVGCGLTLLALGPQLALTLPDRSWIEPATAAMAVDLGYVMLTVAGLPMAVMYAAVAVVSLRDSAFPAWLGWVAAVSAGCTLGLVLALIDPTGALAPQGWLSYVFYLVPVIWLVAAPTVMLIDTSRRPTTTVLQVTVSA